MVIFLAKKKKKNKILNDNEQLAWRSEKLESRLVGYLFKRLTFCDGRQIYFKSTLHNLNNFSHVRTDILT